MEDDGEERRAGVFRCCRVRHGATKRSVTKRRTCQAQTKTPFCPLFTVADHHA